MIQSHWRSYHVRRKKADQRASNIQRHCRGFLVRCVLKNHTAAGTIQRRIVGVLTRKKLRKLHKAATDIQRITRGCLAFRHFLEVKRLKCDAALVIQRHIRRWIAQRIARDIAEVKRAKQLKLKATVDVQKFFRGWKGREKADARRREFFYLKLQYESAMRLQSAWRAKQARRRMEELRGLRTKEMERAADFLRKVWLGMKTRKQYLALQTEYSTQEANIITIQRYMRGCLCRLRMWRDALRTEEELWAAVEIQRWLRGCHGRALWENKYEHMWRRELSAALMQRNIRGWVARVRVRRITRKIAREEFVRSRERFRAAQMMQALARGVLVRSAFSARHKRWARAATSIQKIQRGRALRARLWSQVVDQRATTITAIGRGFLVRNRRFQLIAKVVCIQREYRLWLLRHPGDRAEHHRHMVTRKEHATKLQRHWRQFSERREIRCIHAATM